MYHFERFTQNKIDDLMRLFLESDKSKVSKNKFLKKYDTSFLGVGYVGFLAYDEKNKPAAFYGVIPTLALDRNGQSVLIAQSADTITHPNHQKKGLFVTLAEMTYALAKTLNIQFLYGIPNYLSFPGFIKKLGWKQAGNLQIFKINTIGLPLGNLAKRLPFLNNPYQRYCHFIFKLFTKNTKNAELIRRKHQFQISGDQDFFTYKSYTPKHRRRIADCELWFSVDSYLKIGEIDGLSHKNTASLIFKLRMLGFLLGVHKIVYQCNSIHENYDSLTQYIKPQEGLPIIFKNLSHRFDLDDFLLRYADVDTF